MGKEEFKTFVKKNPKLIKYVQDGSSSWQKFYEIYDIYGEDENAWKDYLGVAEVAATTAGIGDVVKIFKNIKNLKKNINQDQFINILRIR